MCQQNPALSSGNQQCAVFVPKCQCRSSAPGGSEDDDSFGNGFGVVLCCVVLHCAVLSVVNVNVMLNKVPLDGYPPAQDAFPSIRSPPTGHLRVRVINLHSQVHHRVTTCILRSITHSQRHKLIVPESHLRSITESQHSQVQLTPTASQHHKQSGLPPSHPKPLVLAQGPPHPTIPTYPANPDQQLHHVARDA
jgi:hypothetical protein